MATEARTSNLGLMQQLLEKPYEFSFFQAVQLLQRYAGGVPLGHEGPASEELIRIRPTVSMSFPAADMEGIQRIPKSGGEGFRITTSFLGLHSSDSPLPTFYTEDVLWKENDQAAVRSFLDMFHHRAFSLLFRTWEKYRYDVQFRNRGSDLFSQRVYSLLGLGTLQLEESAGVPAVRLLRYAGLITQRPHSAAALAGMLRDYLGLEHLKIEQCLERWVRIEDPQQNRLGDRNCRLGTDLIAGGRVRDRSGKFRITVGPVPLRTFNRLTPVGEDYAALVNIARLFVGDRLDFDIKVKLAADEVPPLQLSSRSPARLGWTSWLPGKPGSTSVVFRQPHSQVPKTQFPWPDTADAGRP
jgi:type VI secretion system protein ImpH